MLAIKGSVGRNGRNLPDDVMLVQALLNKNTPPPLRPLALSGACDENTIATIIEFQRRVVRMPSPDGRVDPGGKTIQSLTGPKPGAPNAQASKVTTSVSKPEGMRQSAWDYLLAFTVRHEGAVLHMYNNRATETAKQDVTCGIGVLLESRDVAARGDVMSMFYDPATGGAPTSDQMRADWDAASKLLRTSKNLAEYGVVCHMRMNPQRVNDRMATILRDQKLPALLRIKEYAGFKDMPGAAQAFCLSFAYGRIPFDFPKMNACVGAGDWKGASGQCRLRGGSEAKNRAHANLLLFAQRVVDSSLNFDTMPAGLDGM
jgi:hypothetical protein